MHRTPRSGPFIGLIVCIASFCCGRYRGRRMGCPGTPTADTSGFPFPHTPFALKAHVNEEYDSLLSYAYVCEPTGLKAAGINVVCASCSIVRPYTEQQTRLDSTRTHASDRLVCVQPILLLRLRHGHRKSQKVFRVNHHDPAQLLPRQHLRQLYGGKVVALLALERLCGSKVGRLGQVRTEAGVEWCR